MSFLVTLLMLLSQYFLKSSRNNTYFIKSVMLFVVRLTLLYVPRRATEKPVIHTVAPKETISEKCGSAQSPHPAVAVMLNHFGQRPGKGRGGLRQARKARGVNTDTGPRGTPGLHIVCRRDGFLLT